MQHLCNYYAAFMPLFRYCAANAQQKDYLHKIRSENQSAEGVVAIACKKLHQDKTEQDHFWCTAIISEQF